ncbi:MAG: SMC-Scp complex subunit ScpB [Pirellulales bacterium]
MPEPPYLPAHHFSVGNLPADQAAPLAESGESPLSLRRLRDVFAAMLKPQEGHPPSTVGSRQEQSADGRQPAADGHSSDPCEISPRSVVEAMLFVGRPDDAPMTARELAAAMRGVSPNEVDAVVAELNAAYHQDGAPYAIVGSAQGYRLALRDEFRRVRDKFYGRVREAKLSPAALEVLSVVAYNQPTTAEEINRLRGRPSGAVLSTLVRRQLVRLDRPGEPGQPPRYATSERFLRSFGLESLAALPQREEVEKP